MTLIEMMVSIAVASILSLAVVTTFSTNSTVIVTHNLKTKANEDGKAAFDMLTRLLRQAKQSSITVTTTKTDITLDFTIPEGYPVWPNNISPYNNNAIRIQWENATSANHPNELRIGKAGSLAGLKSAVLETLVGHAASMETSITDFKMIELAGGKYYELILASQAALGSDTAPSQTIFRGYVLPRN